MIGLGSWATRVAHVLLVCTMQVVSPSSYAQPIQVDADGMPLPDPATEWASLDPRREGAGVASVTGEVAILDPSAASSQHRVVGAGFSFQMVARRKTWPLMVGLGVGVLTFSDQNRSGPVYAGNEADGSFYLGTTRVESSVELRHAELVTRVQPWWGPVRPYLEGEFGLIALWHASSLLDNDGHAIAAREKQRSVAYLTGATAGLDVKLWQVREDTINQWDLVLSLGLKRIYTGPMESPQYAATINDGVHASTVHARVRIWQPFFSLCLAGRSKPRPPSVPAP